MSDGQLIPLNELGIATPDELDKKLESLTRTSDYLPQVRVYGAESSLVKEGKFPMGHLGLYFSASSITDLKKSFDCLVINARPRASIVVGEQPVNFYDYDSKEFTEIKDKATSKPSTPGYLAGMEYLLWIPSVSKFALFFMGTITLRRESANMKALIGKAATVETKLIKTTKFTWHGVDVCPCSTPFQMPTMEELVEENEKFKKPKDSEVELADDTKSSGRAR